MTDFEKAKLIFSPHEAGGIDRLCQLVAAGIISGPEAASILFSALDPRNHAAKHNPDQPSA